MQDFRKLKVWQNAHELTLKVYLKSSSFPAHEQFGLTSQIRRSVTSIPTNIAEACGRAGQKDIARFFQIAMGSACEVDYQLLLIKDLGYLNLQDYQQLLNDIIEIKKMIVAYIKTVKSNI